VKAYEVIVTPQAEAQIVNAFQYIYEDSKENAANWLRALYAEIAALETMPRRCSVARENEYFEDTLRQLVFKSHRIIFRVEEDASIVRILYVLHGRQRTIAQQEHESGDD
jgi:plasmid stabilization system protein ParE